MRYIPLAAKTARDKGWPAELEGRVGSATLIEFQRGAEDLSAYLRRCKRSDQVENTVIGPEWDTPTEMESCAWSNTVGLVAE